MTSKRKVPEHQTEIDSEDQFREVVHREGWEVDRFGRDYGEDLLVRIFVGGNPSGHDFYVQLKGTDDVARYTVKKNPVFSYPLDVKVLLQWRQMSIPVVVVLWDITKRKGFWLYIQPYIEAVLRKQPEWLDDAEGKRQVHIPHKQEISLGQLSDLEVAIERIFEGIKHFLSQIEDGQQELLISAGDAIQNEIKPDSLIKGTVTLPPHTTWELRAILLRAKLAVNAGDVTTWVKLAELYYQLNDMDKAKQAIDRAWELDTRDSSVVWIRACILTEYATEHDGQPKTLLHEAIKLFQSMASDANPALLYYNVGNALSALKKHKQAIKKYDAALNANPSATLEAQIWKNRGTSFFHLGNHVEEIDSYKKALAKNPTLWQAYSSWGVTELRQEDYQHASELFNQALVVNPDLEMTNYEQLYSLAFSLWKLGKYQEAYKRTNQVLTLRPDHEDGHLLKLHLLSILWRENPSYVGEAIRYFKNRVIDKPADSFAKTELALLYILHEKQQDAQTMLEDVVSGEHAPAQALYEYAKILEERGDYIGAVGFLERALQVSPEHHYAHMLAQMRERIGDYHGAIKAYEIALQDVSNPVPILRSVSNSYHFLGDYRACILVLIQGVQNAPRDIDFWNNLLYALIKEGQMEAFHLIKDLPGQIQKGLATEEIQEMLQRLLVRLKGYLEQI